MKKMDLFDLGIVLIIAATGGLDVISEEALSVGLPLLSSSCCLLHAVQKAAATPSGKGLLVVKRILLSRLSPQAQDFICKCMQQRFSQNELKRDPSKGMHMSTSDMLTHPWIIAEGA